MKIQSVLVTLIGIGVIHVHGQQQAKEREVVVESFEEIKDVIEKAKSGEGNPEVDTIVVNAKSLDWEETITFPGKKQWSIIGGTFNKSATNVTLFTEGPAMVLQKGARLQLANMNVMCNQSPLMLAERPEIVFLVDVGILEGKNDDSERCQFDDSATWRYCSPIVMKGNGNSVFRALRVSFIDNSGVFGGSLFVNGTEIFLEKSLFLSNRASQSGGAVFQYSEKLRVNESSFEGNSAEFAGGAMSLVGVDSFIQYSRYVSNSAASFGGAVEVVMGKWSSISNGIFSNTAPRGGGVYGSQVNFWSIFDTVFENNFAPVSGGALYCGMCNVAEIIRSGFFENDATFSGGASDYRSTNKVLIAGNLYQNNTAEYGGATSLLNSNATITESTYYINTASSSGGAIHSDTSVLKIDSSMFDKNEALSSTNATFGGGAISTVGTAFEVKNTSFDGNTAGAYGAALTMVANSENTIIASSFLKNKCLDYTNGRDATSMFIDSSMEPVVVQESSFFFQNPRQSLLVCTNASCDLNACTFDQSNPEALLMGSSISLNPSA